jgi:hypothetical protein
MRAAIDWTGAIGPTEVNVGRHSTSALDLDQRTWGARSARLQQLSTTESEAELAAVFRRFWLLLETIQNFRVLSLASVSRTFGLRSVSAGDSQEDQWKHKNRRRVYLIDKHFTSGLGSEEERELHHLQVEVDRALDTLFPLPASFVESRAEGTAPQVIDRSQA